MVIDWIKEIGDKHVCASCEAEWQCVHMEKTEIFDVVMSKDGDCASLGVETLWHNVNFKDQEFKVHNKSKAKMDPKNNPICKHNENTWSTIGVMLGCDYLPNIHNVGFATLFKKKPFLVT